MTNAYICDAVRTPIAVFQGLSRTAGGKVVEE